MSLPDPDIEMRTATFGRATSYAGNNATITGTVTANQTIIHAATGVRICPDADPMQVVGGELMIDLPVVDQEGFLNGQRVPYTGWMYVLNYTITYASGKTESSSQDFQLFSTDPDVVDVDLRADGPFVPGVTGPQTDVVQVAGVGGPVVSAEALAAALFEVQSGTFVPRWKASTAVLAGALAVAPTGQTIQRIANGTTRSTYDATEIALWTVVSGGGGSTSPVQTTTLTSTGQVLTLPDSATDTILTVVLTQDATGGRTAVWPGTVKWEGSSTPTYSPFPGDRDVFTLLKTATDWLGFPSGAFAAPDVTAPSAPTGLTATPAAFDTVNLSWTAATDNKAVTGYEYRIDSGSAVSAGTGTTRAVTGLTGSTAYTFQVRAFDAAGNRSAWSTAANATTPAAPSNWTYSDTFTGTDGTALRGRSLDAGGVQWSTGASSYAYATGTTGPTISGNKATSAAGGMGLVVPNLDMDITVDYDVSAASSQVRIGVGGLSPDGTFAGTLGIYTNGDIKYNVNGDDLTSTLVTGKPTAGTLRVTYNKTTKVVTVYINAVSQGTFTRTGTNYGTATMGIAFFGGGKIDNFVATGPNP